MRKFIIAFGIIGILALSAQGWAVETPSYGCSEEKGGEVRVVKAPSECLPSETVVALNRTDQEGNPVQKAPEEPQEKAKEYPFFPIWFTGSVSGHPSP